LERHDHPDGYMTPNLIEIVRRSTVYRGALQLREWGRRSTTGRLLDNEPVLVGVLVLGLLASIVRVLVSQMDAPVKFLSFALLFVGLTALMWNYTQPLADQ